MTWNGFVSQTGNGRHVLGHRFVHDSISILRGGSQALWLQAAGVVLVASHLVQAADPAGSIRFDRDIRPLLAENCFACHGPDAGKRQADLRLDTAEGATADRDGVRAVVAGNPSASELLTRISSSDPDVVMPPPDSHKLLTTEEKQLLQQWIAEGAPYESHWAYSPLERPAVPLSQQSGRHPIDAFIYERLKQEGVDPSPAADRVGLARRAAIDITGLPLEPAEVDLFLADTAPDAYEKLIDALLASPHHAERLAAWWLDLVRYGDSVGYHGDQEITMWPYRDWIINAFAANMPFDQFTREQLAGDLLPSATLEQKIAAAYNRLNLMSAEGGGQDKEYLAKYASDRVRATSGAWLGSTLGCAECHDHKFDPFTTRDFYTFSAFFADVTERGIYAGSEGNGKWGEVMRVPTPEQAGQQKHLETQITELKARATADFPELVAQREAWITAMTASPEERATLPESVKAALEGAAEKTPTQQQEIAAFYRSISPAIRAVKDLLPKLEQQHQSLINAQLTMVTTVAGAPRPIRILPRGNWMDDSGEVVLPATPAFLTSFAAATPSDATQAQERLTRLDLANWITAPENSLTPRVLANRLWALCFGQGLSRRLDDHGSQGEAPSHPELLDWLACELRDGQWNIKHLLRTIMTSDAYKRSSNASSAIRESDPENRLMARQARYRIDAEMVRDAALAASGLLARTIGGPSVKPYQPEGYWDYLNFPKRTYKADSGANLYRRGLYVHWQRQYLHPAMLVFDAPSREECTARRARSNTPLQALVRLNDPEFVEAARTLAAKTLAEAEPDARARALFMLRRALIRVPSDAEVSVLADLVERHRRVFTQDVESAKTIISIGASPQPQGVDPIELAAWTSAARTVLNLHETYSRN